MPDIIDIGIKKTAFEKFEEVNDQLSIAELETKFVGKPHQSVRTINMSQSLIGKRRRAVVAAKKKAVIAALDAAGVPYYKVESFRKGEPVEDIAKEGEMIDKKYIKVFYDG